VEGARERLHAADDDQARGRGVDTAASRPRPPPCKRQPGRHAAGTRPVRPGRRRGPGHRQSHSQRSCEPRSGATLLRGGHTDYVRPLGSRRSTPLSQRLVVLCPPKRTAHASALTGVVLVDMIDPAWPSAITGRCRSSPTPRGECATSIDCTNSFVQPCPALRSAVGPFGVSLIASL
jgi:hypothetical protein